MTTINNSIKPIKVSYQRERFGDYGNIYYKHQIKQYQYYNIKLPSYLNLYKLPKYYSHTNKKYKHSIE